MNKAQVSTILPNDLSKFVHDFEHDFAHEILAFEKLRPGQKPNVPG